MDVKSPIESLLEDRAVVEELQEQIESNQLERSEMINNDQERARAIVSKRVRWDQESISDAAAEAIVLLTGRPSLLIQNGSFERPSLQTWISRLEPHRSTIEKSIAAVGRIEVVRHPDFEWLGTGFLVENNLLITNRHVAELFAAGGPGGFSFLPSPLGGQVGARLDLLEEFNPAGPSPEREIVVEEVLFIADRSFGSPDMAVLKVAAGSGHALPDPLELAEHDANTGDIIGVVGYPARDSRNDADAQQQIFGDIFNVKRFAPGRVVARDTRLQHDCTTLGGNSGSAVVDVESGHVIGLHFAGRFRVANFAVPVSTVKSVLRRVTPTSVLVPEEVTAASLRDREGYSESFLGQGNFSFEVPLPGLDAERKQDAVVVNRDEHGMGRFELRYTHFSIVMSRSRRLALYTAVNIDGNQEVSIRRSRGFRLDPRIDNDEQIGEFLYRHNPLDRGHLVRRLDPVWGSAAEAKQAEKDSFFFTNVAPQHANFNQRTWLSLEEHLLTNTNNRDLMITVFTGPVFSNCDPVHRGIKIPSDFWKVVVMVAPSGRLHATGYMLSQARLIDDLEFVFGEFRTFQVPISQIEAKTGVKFDNLTEFDPLESIEGPSIRTLNAVEDIVL